MTQQVRGVVARTKGAPVTVENILVPDPGWPNLASIALTVGARQAATS